MSQNLRSRECAPCAAANHPARCHIAAQFLYYAMRIQNTVYLGFKATMLNRFLASQNCVFSQDFIINFACVLFTSCLIFIIVTLENQHVWGANQKQMFNCMGYTATSFDATTGPKMFYLLPGRMSWQNNNTHQMYNIKQLNL